jgi:hypothetical protein
MELPQPFIEDDTSIYCSRACGQLGKKACMAPKTPPIHSLNAITACRLVRRRKAPLLQRWSPNFEFFDGQPEPTRDNAQGYITMIGNADRSGHWLRQTPQVLRLVAPNLPIRRERVLVIVASEQFQHRKTSGHSLDHAPVVRTELFRAGWHRR